MTWTPPIRNDSAPLRARLPEAGWRAGMIVIAERHRLDTSELEPYQRGETIVWRAGERVIKLTHPDFAFQIAAELSCLQSLTDGYRSTYRESSHTVSSRGTRTS